MRTIFSLILLFITRNAFAQLEGQPFVDSLVSGISTIKNDTAKAKLYKLIVDNYIDTRPQEAMLYAELGLKHVKSMKWNKGIAVFYMLSGNLYSDKGNYTKAIELFNDSYLIHAANKDNFNAASALNNSGTAYLRQSVFEKAAENYFKALKLAESINDQNLIAICLNNIGLTYFNQNDYTKALEYQFKALNLYKAVQDKDGMADNYLSIGSTYLQKKDSSHARKYYTDAIALYKQANNLIGVANAYTNLSILIQDHAVNLDYKLKAQKIWDELNPAYTASLMNMGNIANLYLDIARYDTLHNIHASPIIPTTHSGLIQKADEYLNRAVALSIETGDMRNFAFLTGLQSEMEAEKGDFKKAYFNIKAFHNLNDSIYSQENKNKIAAVEGQREVALRDKEIELNKLALSAQKRQRIALIAGIGLLLVIGMLLYRQSRMRKKTNTVLLQLNNELDEANKVKAKFFAILSHDLRSPVANLVDFLHLQKAEPGLLSAEQTAFHEQKITASAEALLENMETMLLWSKEQMGNFKPQLKPVTASDLFGYLQKTFGASPNINFIFSDPANLFIVSDESYLQVILCNLTSNAIKALNIKADPAIEWKAFKDNEKTVLSITDNGPGINKEFAKVLYSENITYNNKTGLGLHLVRDLCKAINCHISVHSDPGMGTSFELVF